MKVNTFILAKILIFIFVSSLLSCEKEPVDTPDKGNTIISDSRPMLRNESITTSSSDNYSINNSFNNPFKAVEFHNPSAIGLVQAKVGFTKKATLENNAYHLYELSTDSFRMVKGKEGNEILFRDVHNLIRINDTWQIFRGGELITLETQEMQINVNVEISTDSIFLADTIPASNMSFGEYENIGDTVFVSADTTIFNDTLWIQKSYVFSDTVSIERDTTSFKAIEQYMSLLLNIKTGELYEIGTDHWNPAPLHYPYSQPSFFDYNPENNCAYFGLEEFKVGKINLTELEMEVINMPSDQVYYGINGMGGWFVLEDDNIVSSNSPSSELFCYLPGVGIRKKHNWNDANSIFNSMNWRGPDNKRYILSGYTQNVYQVEFRNDSIVFNDAAFTFDHKPTSWYQTDPEYGPNIFSLTQNGEKWYYDGAIFYSIDTPSKRIVSFGMMGEIITNGFLCIFHRDNTIFKVDFNQRDAIEIFKIEGGELDNIEITINANNNIIVSGFRVYDFKNIVIEYDSQTGALINEWEEENAPPANNVYQLSPVYDD